MNDTVITVENLCKKYTIGHQKQARYETFRENLNHMGRGMLQRLQHPLSTNKENIDLEEFWALKDLNFEIQRGDRVGIIGRNGAGKSTLLKILSRITEPSSGRVAIRGRVASLLEVGTGFHPELTGRENIFLNGAILGMSRVEIKKKFDEIVDFAEIEKFLDTPVKRYSSGMYVRLAFAVAAHLEPEILLVDEVLAVGDAEFQKKCLGKMGQVAKEGRTILFVSHNMAAIESLCSRAILLKNGRKFQSGKPSPIIGQYVCGSGPEDLSFNNKNISLDISLTSENDHDSHLWELNKEISIAITVVSKKYIVNPTIDLTLYTEDRRKIMTAQSDKISTAFSQSEIQKFQVVFTIKNPGLLCEKVIFDIGIRSNNFPTYLGCWQYIASIPVSHKGISKYCSNSSIIWLPCSVSFN